jgi:Ca-activated chloride channel family protein
MKTKREIISTQTSSTAWAVPKIINRVLVKIAIPLLLLLLTGQEAYAIGRVYARFPNNASSPIFNLRIKDLHADVKIQDQLAVTHVDQEFANDNSSRLEGFYVFQLPEGAQVNELYLWINGVRTPYTVKKRADAVERYTEIVNTLKDPAVLEQLGSNTFQLRIFPFDAFKTRRIEIVYTQPLSYFKGSIQYTFPLDMRDYSSAPIENVTITIDIHSQVGLNGVETSVDQFPTAAIVTKYDSAHYAVAYGVEKVSFSKDFFIRSQLAASTPKMYTLTYLAPDSLKEKPYFLLWLTTPDTLVGDTSKPKAVTFVADVSSSMEGIRLSQLRDALQSFIDLMNTRDKFNIVVFSTGVTSFRSDLVPATVSARDSARAFIAKLTALGLTNIEAAIHSSLLQSYTDPNHSSIIFLTDGQASWGETNADSIVARSKRWNEKQIPFYTVGVGDEADYSLLMKLAQSNDGVFMRIAAEDSIYLKVKDLYRMIILPPLRELMMHYATFDAFDVHPAVMPVLYAGDQLLLTGRFTSTGKYPLSLTGTVDGTPFSIDQEVSFPDTDKTLSAIARYWGAKKIKSLLDMIAIAGEQKELVDQIVALSIRYSVLTPYTAFLVVEPQFGSGTSVKDPTNTPFSFELQQNFPNPFNPTTTIRYTVSPGSGGPRLVTLSIFDLLGRCVRTLVAQVQTPGWYEIVWDGKGDDARIVPSGMYIYRLTAGGETAAKTMILLK